MAALAGCRASEPPPRLCAIAEPLESLGAAECQPQQCQLVDLPGGSGADEGQGIAMDSSGNVYVSGSTYSTDFSGANNIYGGDADAFVAEVTSAGTQAWATYLGGPGGDYGEAIALDGSGNILVTGSTNAPDFPAANDAFHGQDENDAFVVKLAAPTVSGVVINGNLPALAGAQRSMVDSIVYTFSQAVKITGASALRSACTRARPERCPRWF